MRALPLASVVGVLVLVLWRTGPGKVPNVEGFEGIARFWPLYPVAPEQAYVLREGLGQALYHALGWAGTGHYLVLHAAVLVVAGLLLATWIALELGVQRGAVAVCLVLLAPVTPVLLEWIGMYDAFSVLVWVLLLLALRRNAWVQGAVAVLGGVQNFEQFAISVVVLALLPELCRARGVRPRPVALLAGSVAGKIALELYLRSTGAADGTRLSFLADSGTQHLVLSTFAVLAPVVLFSALGPLWVPVARLAPAAWAATSPWQRWRVAGAGVTVLLVGIVAADHTRVMVLVGFPVLVLLCMELAARQESVRAWLRTPEAWLLLLVPPLVVWSGEVLPLGLTLATGQP